MSSTSISKPLSCLVVDDEEDLRDLLGFVLENEFKAVVYYASSGNEAIDFLKKNREKIDLIVCDYRMGDGNGGDVFKFLHEPQKVIPFILCSSDHPGLHPEFQSHPLAGYAEKPFFQKPLIAAVQEIIKNRVKAAEFSEVVQSAPADQPKLGANFGKVHIRLMKRVNVLPCPAFIKLSESKFVKLYHSLDVFADQDFLKYQNKNVNYLYIPQKEVDIFFEKVLKEFLNSLEFKKLADQGPTVLFDGCQDIEDSIHDIGSKLGFTKELERMTKANVQLTLKLVSQNPSLSELLKKINYKDPNYISSHSIVLCCITCWIATKMEWQSDQTFSKLILASFLHDVTLDDHELAKVQEEGDFLKEDIQFSSEGVVQWRAHPLKAAEISTQFTEVPPDVDVIIAQHHERPHGDGIPYRLNHTRIAPLSALFIIAQDLFCFFESHSPEADLVQFVEKTKAKYDMGHFKKIIQAITTQSKSASEEVPIQ